MIIFMLACLLEHRCWCTALHSHLVSSTRSPARPELACKRGWTSGTKNVCLFGFAFLSIRKEGRASVVICVCVYWHGTASWLGCARALRVRPAWTSHVVWKVPRKTKENMRQHLAPNVTYHITVYSKQWIQTFRKISKEGVKFTL